MYIRYIQTRNGKVYGLFMGGYDLSGLTGEEMEEFYRHPAQLPSPELACKKGVFAFKDESAENRWLRMIQLRAKAAIGPVERLELSPDNFDIIWSDENQVALTPKSSFQGRDDGQPS